MDQERLTPDLLKLAGILLVGAVAVQLDTTIVSVALATLARSFAAPLATIQWVTTAYPLALGAVLLVAFVLHALRTRIQPLIDVRLFRSRAFTASAALMFLGGLSIF